MAHQFGAGICAGIVFCAAVGCGASHAAGEGSRSVKPVAAPVAAPSAVAQSAIHLYPAQPELQLRLAQRYADGDGVPRDALRASSWALRAAIAGHAAAVAWLEQRAQSKDAFCELALALVYTGSGPARAPTKAPTLLARAKASLMQAAQAGDPASQYALAILHRDGEPDATAAERWLRQSANAGYAPAQRALARLLAPKDAAGAVEWFRKAAAQADADAEFDLGLHVERGNGTVKSDSIAAQHFERAAQLGLPAAERRLGKAYLEGRGVKKDPTEGLRWLARANDHGDDAAALELSRVYQQGKHVPQNQALSLELCTRAAQHGLADAQSELGLRYSEGTGVARDLVAARRWFEKAAAQDNGPALYLLALSYDGEGPDEDPKRALELYQRAAEHGISAAESNIGVLYAGTKLGQDLAAALKWYRRAAEHGNATAQHNLGWMYVNGEGTEKNPAQAFAWFSRAAESGSPRGMTDVGYCYENGIGVGKDLARAREWYERSAQQGDVMAQIDLGSLYERGLGVPKDLHAAIEWYRKAASKGDARGAQELGRALRFWSGPDYDAAEGCKQLLIAAKAGRAGAQYGFAKCLETGVGVPRDDAAAAFWYAEGAKQRHAGSEYELGLAYAEGRGVPADVVVAERLLVQANTHGDKDARQALADLRERTACARHAKTELFGVKLACASRRELRRALSRSDAPATSESDDRWYDSYDSSHVLDESRTLQLWYTRDNAWLARATYEFPSHVDAGQVVRIAERVARKYGRPTSQRGNPSLGPMRYEWVLPDGVQLSIHRDWPDTTTHMDYKNPKRLAQMDREIAHDDGAARKRREASQSGAF
ncbi:MAG: tetratricopeptide repeat protein [Myxococcota bacterium]